MQPKVLGDAVLGSGRQVRAAGSGSRMSVGDSDPWSGPEATSGEFLATFSAPLTLLSSASTVEGSVPGAPLAADVMMPPASCGIIAGANGHPLTMTGRDLRAFEVDEAHTGANEGRHLDALDTGAVMGVLPDLLAGSRWPRFRPRALRRHPGPGRGARPRPARARHHRREGARR